VSWKVNDSLLLLLTGTVAALLLTVTVTGLLRLTKRASGEHA
jgi:hypothetical protein